MGLISSSRTLHCLVYCSKQSFTPDQIIDAEIDLIVAKSVLNNEKSDITGLLLIHDGWFVQALEGPAERVMTTYHRILSDKRHTSGQVISAGPILKRSFSNWNMCARRFSKANDAILDTLSQRDAFRPPSLRGPAALRLLTSVSDIQSRLSLASESARVRV